MGIADRAKAGPGLKPGIYILEIGEDEHLHHMNKLDTNVTYGIEFDKDENKWMIFSAAIKEDTNERPENESGCGEA